MDKIGVRFSNWKNLRAAKIPRYHSFTRTYNAAPMAMPSGRSDDCSTAGSEKSSAPGLPPRSAPANRRGPRPGVPSCKRRCVVAAADTLFGGLLAGTLILLFSYVADMVADGTNDYTNPALGGSAYSNYINRKDPPASSSSDSMNPQRQLGTTLWGFR